MESGEKWMMVTILMWRPCNVHLTPNYLLFCIVLRLCGGLTAINRLLLSTIKKLVSGHFFLGQLLSWTNELPSNHSIPMICYPLPLQLVTTTATQPLALWTRHFWYSDIRNNIYTPFIQDNFRCTNFCYFFVLSFFCQGFIRSIFGRFFSCITSCYW